MDGSGSTNGHTKDLSLADEYRRQRAWRSWPRILDALPSLRGQMVLDLGCGVGDCAGELVARGARVVGVDLNDELLQAARARGLAGAEFLRGDLRAPLELDVVADGIWCSLTAAYFPELPVALEAWARHLRAGGWAALTEIDDLFGHEPLSARARSLLDAYAGDALAAGRYDFHMGRKLREHLERSGFAVSQVLSLDDAELAFSGPASPEVVAAWRRRFDRMRLLRDFCAAEFEQVREEFLECLQRYRVSISPDRWDRHEPVGCAEQEAPIARIEL